MKIKTFWQNLITPRRTGQEPGPIPGLYHWERQAQGERSRIHLRIDPDGSGLLMINANRVMHLNPTAAFMAYWVLEGIPEEKALQTIIARYEGPADQIRSDYAQITSQISQLVRPDGACPIHELDLDVTLPFSARPSAPYRMDLALTYRCNNECAHCYNARPRSYPEMSTEQWKQVIDRLWEISIPHVVFTGGEPTLRDDLPELIAHAEQKGQITGLNTNARRLSDPKFVAKLVEAGLDHVQITLESHDARVHNRMVGAGETSKAWDQTVAGLENVLDSPLFVMTNTTLLQENSPSLAQTLEFLATKGVPTVGMNALIYSGRGATVGTGLKESELPPLLDLARQFTDDHQQRLIWYTPTEYCNFDPVQLELGVKGCTAALYNMCVEPDGAVIPCQSYYESLGSLLDASWETIWNHPTSIYLRERQYLQEKCNGCALLTECGGGCPLVARPSTGR